MADKRPVGDEAIREIVRYVVALAADELKGPNYPESHEVVGRKLKGHECIRPVGDYIHGVYVSEIELMWRKCDRSRNPNAPRDEDNVSVHVSQYLTNCPVQAFGRDIADALANLKRFWGAEEAARNTLAQAGWGPRSPGAYSHPAYSG
jgi:hypothetical protein